jgi:hypothetical protein
MTALDVIGYNFSSQPVPEPSSLAMVSLGSLIVAGFAWKRQRQAATV